MTTDVNFTLEFNRCYKYLAKTFGAIYCTGCRYLAGVVALYKPGTNLQNVYKEYAEMIGSTPAAIERGIRVYLDVIQRDYTLEDFSTVLEYKFNSSNNKIKPSELVPIIKIYLDEQLQAAQTNEE